MKRLLFVSTTLFMSLASIANGQEIPAEYQQVLTALAKHGDFKANVLKVNIPRNDVSVTVANVKTRPSILVMRLTAGHLCIAAANANGYVTSVSVPSGPTDVELTLH